MSGWRKRQILEAQSNSIIKSDINKMLLGLLGSEKLLESWWSSSNKGLDNLTPNDVYWSGAEGRQRVFDYVAGFCFI
jgi:hypothetical protein